MLKRETTYSNSPDTFCIGWVHSRIPLATDNTGLSRYVPTTCKNLSAETEGLNIIA